jgi:hypothetical protein
MRADPSWVSELWATTNHFHGNLGLPRLPEASGRLLLLAILDTNAHDSHDPHLNVTWFIGVRK